MIRGGRLAKTERSAAGRRYFLAAMDRRVRPGAAAMAEFCLAGLPAKYTEQS